jgi:hypothetical protein
MAFNSQVENFLGAVERRSWRRGFPGTAIVKSLGRSRGARPEHPRIQIDRKTDGADVVRLHRG